MLDLAQINTGSVVDAFADDLIGDLLVAGVPKPVAERIGNRWAHHGWAWIRGAVRYYRAAMAVYADFESRDREVVVRLDAPQDWMVI